MASVAGMIQQDAANAMITAAGWAVLEVEAIQQIV
jgi:hypothetical protein